MHLCEEARSRPHSCCSSYLISACMALNITSPFGGQHHVRLDPEGGGWVTALAAIPALASSSPVSTMFKTGADGEDSGGH